MWSRTSFWASTSVISGLAGFGVAAHNFSSLHTAHAESKTPFVQTFQWKADKFTNLKVSNVVKATKDMKLIYFDLPLERDTLGFTPIVNVLLKTNVNGENVIKPYNPITLPNEPGRFAIAVKRYGKDAKMGSYVHNLIPGDSVQVKGPNQQWKYTRGDYKRIGIIAGGTGVTPCLQAAQAILNDSEDNTKIDFLICQKTREDVFCKQDIDQLAANSKGQMTVNYCLEDAGDSFYKTLIYEKGYVTAEMIEKYMPGPDEEDIKILVCGPKGFVEAVSGWKKFEGRKVLQGELKGFLNDMGYVKSQVQKI